MQGVSAYREHPDVSCCSSACCLEQINALILFVLLFSVQELTDADEQRLKGLRLDAKTKQVGYRCLYHAILFVRHTKLFQGIKDVFVVVVVFSCRQW